MKKILIISKDQFGYHTDINKWCQYLRDSYDVSVLTFNDGKEKMDMDGVKNIYVPNARYRLLRGILFLVISTLCIIFSNGIIIVCYFKQCTLYKRLCPRKRMILDIRTLDVSGNEIERKNNDNDLRKCVRLYDFVTCISEGVRQKACVPVEKSTLLPLGAEMFPFPSKKFDTLKLLYIGTLLNRNIEKTVHGLAIAMKTTNIDIEYDIVGDSLGNELDNLKSYIVESGLENNVHVHGYIRHDLLTPFFEKCNIGVSFIPMTDYYDYQPPTKTFEYALSGLYVIATSTTANKEIINSDNGLLIEDTAESFANALIEIIKNKKSLDSSKIKSTLEKYQWKNIVESIFKPILENWQK